MRKKLNTILKLICIVLTCIFIASFIVGMLSSCGIFFCNVDFNYEIDTISRTVKITGIKSITGFNLTSVWHITIPEIIDGYPVTAIDDYAFKDNENILTVEVPQTITYIGKGAFYNCTNLAIVFDLENCTKIKSIEPETFYNCKFLKKIILPNGIDSIGEYAFKSCHNLTNLDIPASVRHIGKRAFDNCQTLEEIIVPQGVQTIEEGTFFSCLKIKTISLPEGITTVDSLAFANCYELTSIDLPTTLVAIGENAFNNCYSIYQINIPDGVTAISSGMFIQCNSLAHITIPSSVNYISYNAFDFCSVLQEVQIDSNNQNYYSIDGAIYDKINNIFVRYLMGAKGETLIVLNNIKIIGKAALAGNPNLSIVHIPQSVTKIDEYALYASVINTINYGGTVKEWQSIEKASNWDLESSEYTIYCTDGQIAKDGTVTYN